MFNILKKHELTHELSCAALKAFEVLTKTIYGFFDPKCHQASLESFKQVVQLILKKFESFISSAAATSNEQLNKLTVPISLALKGLLTALNLFPNCCAQLVTAKAPGNKRTHAGTVLETMIALYNPVAQKQNSASARQIVKLCILIEAQFIRARENQKKVYKESIERVLQNILIYLDVLKPRTFDAEDLNKDLPLDSTFVFWHLSAQKNAAEVGKLMVKDFKD